MTIRRRSITTALAGSLLMGQRWAHAQAAERVWRVGVLRPTAQPIDATELVATGIPRALRELGYVEGRNLVLESRWAQGAVERLPPLADELVQAKVDVIIAVGAAAVRAAKGATTTIPIILFGNLDPVALGLVASLARPGGNVTGVLIAPDGTLAGKKLELLKAAVPAAKKIAFLAPPDDPATRLQVQETRLAAAALGTELLVTEVQGSDYGRAFAAIVAQRPGALLHRRLCRPHFQGRQTRRDGSGATNQVRVGHQSEDRQGTGFNHSAIGVAAGGRGDSVSRRADPEPSSVARFAHSLLVHP